MGTHLASHYKAQGAPVQALVRSEQRRAVLAAQGLAVLQADLDRPLAPGLLEAEGAVLFYLVPPPREGEHDTRLQAVLEALEAEAQRPARLVYMSTSGVYGDCAGAWVDEAQPARPGSARARRRLDAEMRLGRWCSARGISALVLRVGGIYGPGRLPRARLEKGLPVLHRAESGYSNRIHIDDLLQACIAAVEHPEVQGVVNVCDDAPSTMTDYFLQVAAHLGLPEPPRISLEQARAVLSPAMLEYLSESRRLRNTRLHRELGVELRYPDLAAGLAALARG